MKKGLRKGDKREWLSKPLYSYPPDGKFLAKEYLEIYKEMQNSDFLKGSKPCFASEGGFEWDADEIAKKHHNRDQEGCMQIRSYNATAPLFESTWEETEKKWEETEGKMDEVVNKHHPFCISWRSKCFTPPSFMKEFKDILKSRGWTFGTYYSMSERHKKEQKKKYTQEMKFKRQKNRNSTHPY